MIKPGKIAKLLLKSLFKKPATINYPAQRSGMPSGYRGKIGFNPQLCIGCKICMRDCPSAAIEIKSLGDKKFTAEVNLGKCIYCGQCVESCPKKALCVTAEFELASLDAEKLKIVLDAKSKDSS